MKKRLLLIGLIFMLMIPVSLIGLMSSASGSRWLVRTVLSSLSARISVKSIEGRLAERLVLTEIHFQSDTETIAVNKFVFAWQPAQLFSGTFKIVDLTLNNVSVSLAEAKAEEQSGFDVNTELRLPLNIVIDNLLVTDFNLQQGGQRQQLERLQLTAFTGQGRLNIVSLTVNAQQLAATAQGKIELGKGFPFRLTADWQAETQDYGKWQAITNVTGDMRLLSFDSLLSSPFKLSLKGSLANLLDTPSIKLRGDWQKLNWPLTGKAKQVSSEQGYFELAGLLRDYKISLNGDLTQPYLPKARIAFKGQGGTDALFIETVEVDSTAGVFRVGGNVAWKDGTAFDLNATGKNFNPAILLPELPGSLTFDARIKGKLAGETLQLDADINKLSGKLRGHPVSANGKLALAGEQLKVDALEVVSGANRIAVNGTLGQKNAALEFTIDTPALASLWPGLGGSLKGDGRVQGAWKNPSVQVEAKGKQLRFGEHSIERLAIDIGYHADSQKTSKISLSAGAIKTGATQIQKIVIDGMGTLEQHRFKVDIGSSYGELSSTLNGSINAKAWQGEFSSLDLTTLDFGRWQLKNKPVIRVAKIPAGFDLRLDEACLSQQTASICTQGGYNADSDFSLQAKASALPTGLLQGYLPEQMKLQGIINADADIQQQKGALSGSYRLTMPANAKVLLKTQHASSEFALGPASLSGTVKGTTVSADFDLALVEHDYLRGRLQLDTGKTQALSGQIRASVLNFALVKPFIPNASNLKGKLTADFSLLGTLAKPVFNGTAALEQGAINMAESGFGLHDINLQAEALGGNINRIHLQGSAVPVVLNQKDAPEQLRLKGMINLSADLQQEDGLLNGRYRIDVPANASITVKANNAVTKIPLGASSLSGTIIGDIISADLNLALAARDYLRAQMQLNTGESQALSGQVTASIVEFGLLNPFVPQLSNMKGNLKADLAVNGTAGKPVVNGTVKFTNGSVDFNELGVELRDIKLQALATANRSDRLQISGSAKSGQGAIKLDGFADLQGTAELMLSGTDFEVAKLPEAQIAVSPDLKLTFANRQGKVAGRLRIPKATLQLKEIPENAVEVSSDEIILGEEKTAQKEAVAVNVDADIEVELGKQISFSGQGLKTNLSGKLKINKTGEKLAMFGVVDMNKARYKSYGQDLTVRRGRFLFNGPVDKPWLDVEAIRISKSKEVTAILNLTGPLEAPKTLISSEPALPEAEALAYLITGGPLNQVSKAEGNLVASAALSYGAGQVSWIADKLGIDELEVKEGKTLQDTLVGMGQYLTPDFYLGAKVGLFNKQAVLVLKRKLTSTLNVETQTGTSQRIKLNYEFDTD